MLSLTDPLWGKWVSAELVPRLPAADWNVTSFGLVFGPSTWFVQGIALSGSSGAWFHAHAFALPLFRPTERVYFNHSVELRDETGRQGFDLPDDDHDANIAGQVAADYRARAVEFISEVGALEGFGSYLQREQALAGERGSKRVPYTEEAGYTLLIMGETEAAVRQLTMAAAEPPQDAPSWDIERAQRAGEVLGLLQESRERAIARLAQWAAESAGKLRVDWTPPRT